MKHKPFIVPPKPGVYILKGAKERVIYVGKAKNLRNRLRTYFQRTEDLDERKRSMVRLIRDFSYIVTGNELEALILEANLIKQYKPQFNIILRDDKNYPYLKLTISEKWPKLEVVRRIAKDGSVYFGPYVPAHSMWDALAFIRKNFSIRTCKYALDKPMRPCIQHQMGRCSAPCADMIGRDEYMKIVEDVRLFLNGERKELLSTLEQRMQKLSDDLRFEEAASVRDRLMNLNRIWELQRVISPELGDIDAIGFYSDMIDSAFKIFFIRNGVLTGSRDFYVRDSVGLSNSEIMHSFIEMFYSKELIPPDEVIVRHKPDDIKNLSAWLRTKKRKKVKIVIPRQGKRFEVLEMADENALQIFRDKNTSGIRETLNEIKNRLNLPCLPHAIGAFDVSTISGSESVGAFIYWSEGKFIKDLYRRIKIKTVAGTDDYAMLAETVSRTLKNLNDNMPELIIVDGGKGQLETARSVITTEGLTLENGQKPMLISIAKDPDRAFAQDNQEVMLEDNSHSSLLLRKLRDEVHRFAITYHKKLRDKRLMESPLEKIAGVGKKRRFELLKHFGSIDAIRKAPAEEIAGLKGFNRKVAENISAALKEER